MEPKLPVSRFCPRCGSTELEEFIGFQSGQFKCKKCGFTGFAMEGDYKFINEFKRNLSEGKK
ncbi:MAG: hypothetical protein JW703_03700 [Candidatus Diapherotrites archaeon]|nr:hypothetical protein [Candidatus Diapherotrites archaeon]